MWEHFQCGVNTFPGLEKPTSGALKCTTIFTASVLALNMSFPVSRGRSFKVFGNMVTQRLGSSVHRFQKSSRALLSRKECQLIESIRPANFHGKC